MADRIVFNYPNLIVNNSNYCNQAVDQEFICTNEVSHGNVNLRQYYLSPT